MAEYTLDEMREQARKAGVYFARGMEGFDKTYIALRARGTLVVVARDSSADKLAEFVDSGGLGKVTSGVEDVEGQHQPPDDGGKKPTAPPPQPEDAARSVRPPAEPAQPQTESSTPDRSASASSGTTGPASGVDPAKPVLIALYHAPKEEFARKGGNIHLHVLSDAKLGRRERKTGECLCQKKRGSKEKMPEPGQTRMCEECVKVAEQNGLAWTL